MTRLEKGKRKSKSGHVQLIRCHVPEAIFHLRLRNRTHRYQEGEG